ncbi:hypothetical protein NP493_1251g00020 [Ridgeia piscesae]|uniref:HYR domain-containing protein n=1 Tax=Ridgeia piscesae TaxID=27915 RepID=A0AAD9KAV4_RIDPI|nr:hypothetical protein NP493_1251g00020 [Ridgeia piscesae]
MTRTGPAPNTSLTVGTHRVTYNARDSAGNKAFPCSFTVNVRRVTCPVVYRTPYQRVSCPMGHKYGAVCHLSCDEGKELLGSPTATCDVWPGVTPPVAAWSWSWNSSQPMCQGRSRDNG